ncbi:MAG: hypothetical protein CMP59_09925 [Flavobacteriales bacterium]|nr:hypothetical protein [Flavobacteriales bacterium]
MIKGIRNFILKRKQSKQYRKVQVYNLDTAKTALVLYNFTTESREKEIRDFCRFLKEEGIKTSSLAYISKKIKEGEYAPREELNYHYFDKSELNWLRIPKSDNLKGIIEERYDILIDFNLEESFPIKWISVLSQASFKVGSSRGYKSESCDLLMELKEESIASLQSQCKVYLRMINQKN